MNEGRSPSRVTGALLLSVCWGAGCDGPAPVAEVPGSRFLRTVEVLPEENQVALPPYDFREAPGAMPWKKYLEEIEEPMPADDGRPVLIHVDLDRGIERAVPLDVESLAVIAEELRARGFADASPEPDAVLIPLDEAPQEPPSTLWGWSNGIDSRVRKSVDNGYPTTENSLRRMGQVNSGCTGTLVGRRIVLTAAHCVLNSNLTWPTQTYKARRDGSTLPYGTESTSSIIYDNQFVANDCHLLYDGSTFDQCVRWDWAVMVLHEDAWDSVPDPGYMGIRSAGESALEGYAALHDGYPGCSHPEAPASCRSSTAYGQTFSCSIDYFAQPNTFVGATPLGYNLTFRHSCDMSRGHSGGAVYTYDSGSNGPYVLGVNVWQMCTTCSTATGAKLTHPNVAVRIKPWLGNFLVDLRSQYP